MILPKMRSGGVQYQIRCRTPGRSIWLVGVMPLARIGGKAYAKEHNRKSYKAIQEEGSLCKPRPDKTR